MDAYDMIDLHFVSYSFHFEHILVLNMFMNHMSLRSKKKIMLQVDGIVGIGKPYLIDMVSKGI